MIDFPKDRIYLLEVPPQAGGGKEAGSGFKTVSQLIETGKSLPKVEKLNWSAGEGARRTAFLCYSSGTSGLPVSNQNLTVQPDYADVLFVLRKES